MSLRERGRKIMAKIPFRKPLLGSKWGEAIWVAGIFSVSLGVALCSVADLGVSMIAAPAFLIYEAAAPAAPWLTVGTAEYMYQGLILIAACLLIRRFDWRFLLSFVVAVIYGYLLDMWLKATADTVADTVLKKYLLLIAGILCTAFGVTCFFRSYLPMEVYELFVAETAKAFRLKTERMKLIYDVSQLSVTLILALTLFDPAEFDWKQIYRVAYHSLGTGTVIATFLNAPLIAFFGRALDALFGYDALIKPLKKALALPSGKKAVSSSDRGPEPEGAESAER